MVYKIILALVFFITILTQIQWHSQYAWVPPYSLDPSGLDAIPNTNILLVLNDRGYVRDNKKRWLSQLRVDAQHIKAIPLHLPVHGDALTGDYKTTSKWDGEAIRCETLPDLAIGCIGVSGKRDHIFWIEATSVSAAAAGEFTLQRSFRISHAIKTQPMHQSDNPYEIEALAFLHVSERDIRVLLLSRGPVDRYDGGGHYYQYELTLQRTAPQQTFPEPRNSGYSVRQSGRLAASSCPADADFAYSFKHYIRLADVFRKPNSNQGYLMCTEEGVRTSSTLVPIIFHADHIRLDPSHDQIVIRRNDIRQRTPFRMKIEGLTCLQETPWVAIDADGFHGGVFALSEAFAHLCQETT